MSSELTTNGGVWGPRAEEKLILVNEGDEALGTATRAECHEGEGLLHRAFSVYLFDDLGRLMIHRRHDSKPLWPGFWSNSCCSHPRHGEDVLDAARRRTKEELGLDIEPVPIHRYAYRAKYEDVGSEYELVHVFVARCDPDAIEPDPEEIADLRLFDVEAMDGAIGEESIFTPWFRMAWPTVRDRWEKALAD
ncbi:MAG: isopentenyl-diphosphate delta-isomerase [Planctomycetota bacterium]|jgi:isopentenyl-diphosphate delta-isomerase